VDPLKRIREAVVDSRLYPPADNPPEPGNHTGLIGIDKIDPGSGVQAQGKQQQPAFFIYTI
jgi:hypothetical protein